MEYKLLGDTQLKVSQLCLGTMTFGEQNNQAEAFAQMDLALDAGINFFDTAEMYPVPPQASTYGQTETIIGRWLKERPGARQALVLASKVAGPSDVMRDYIRPDLKEKSLHFDAINIRRALESSLKRLQTDYLDLYQLHWPDRHCNYFGQLGYGYGEDDPYAVPLLESLQVLDDCVRAGMIRHIGLSNETPWGVMKSIALAEQHGLSKVVSVQNPYNLLNRSYEVGLAEIAHREQVGLLAYSPLAFGVLTGKYRNKQRPTGARLTLFSRFSRYDNAEAQSATEAYLQVADDAGLRPTQLALAFVSSRPFVTSNIIGATSLEQLQENIDSQKLQLEASLLSRIEAIHQSQPNPAP